MPRSLLVVFSQGGTTMRVALSIAAGLRSAGYTVELHGLRDGQPPVPGSYDLLGVGSPTYYYRPPFNVVEYLKGLPDLAGLPAFPFVLHGTYQGEAGNIMRKILAAKGATEVGTFCCHGADRYLPYLRQGTLFSPDRPSAGELAAAEEFGRLVAARVAGHPYAKPQDDPPPAAIYRFERLITSRWLAERLYSRFFRVDRGRCTACGTCIQGCPTGNITADAEGHPVWGRDCLLCLYCEMTCPEEAITSPGGWPLTVAFARYNVRRAALDPELEYARVKHSRGQLQRL